LRHQKKSKQGKKRKKKKKHDTFSPLMNDVAQRANGGEKGRSNEGIEVGCRFQFIIKESDMVKGALNE
jgi:hypothetical protein